jgi:hypothetical protein
MTGEKVRLAKRWASAVQLPPVNWLPPPDGNRSRLFLSNEKAHFSGISLRAAGRHQSSVAGGERKGLGFNHYLG